MRRAVLAVAVLVLFTACPRDEGRESRGENAALTPVIDPNKEMPTGLPPVAHPLQNVELTEYAIHMPATVPPGTHSFRVMNAGTEKHSFEIEGNGVEVKLPDDLTRGDMKTIDVTLKTGTYDVYCPVDNHKGRGMKTTLVVK